MAQSFEITKKKHDYLLPIYGNAGTGRFLVRIDRKVEKYYFIGEYWEFVELLHRCLYL